MTSPGDPPAPTPHEPPRAGGGSSDPDFGARTEFTTFFPETLGEQLPGWEILREVGKGSMGIVYEARRRKDGQRVALKILPPSLTLTERTLARFQREAQLMAKMHHPAIATIIEQGHSGRLHFFAMEFVDGTTLHERLAIGPLPARQAAEIARDAARALHFAHERGIVHRDVKPGNIMLREGGGIAITDFGLARETGTGSMTESGAIVGTPMFMAPEVVLAEDRAHPALVDVYGMGATLYTALTGRPPFEGPTAQGVLTQVLDIDPPRPCRLRRDLPRPLEAVVLKAMEKEPARRYGSAQDLADDLQRFLDDGKVLARRPGPLARTARAAARRPTLTTLIVLVLVLSLGAWELSRQNRSHRVQTDLAEAEKALALAAARADDPRGDRTPAERRALLHEAVAAASAALATDPDAPRAWFVRAVGHYRLGNYPAALRNLDRAEALLGSPGPEILHYRIETLGMFRDPANRQRRLDDLMTLLRRFDSDHTRCLVAENILSLAHELEPLEQPAVLDILERVLAPIPQRHPRGMVARARLLELRGEEAAALTLVRAAVHENQADLVVQSEAARMFERLGLFDEGQAARDMVRALQMGVAPPPEEPAAIDADSTEAFLRQVDQLLKALGSGTGK